MDKNQIRGIPSNFPSSSSHSFDSVNSNAALKFYGLKKKNYFKLFRKQMTQLASYIYSVSPPFRIVHKIMAAIQILQFLLPCLIPAYLTFWEKGTPEQVTMNVIAVLYYLIPPTVDFRGTYVFFIIYIVLQIIMILIVIISSFYFKKHAKLPGFIPPLIYLYQSTFGYYFHPIVLYMIFETISYLVTGNFHTKISLTSICFLFTVALICVCFNFFFMSISSSQTLLFRPTSFVSFASQPQYLIIISTILINVFFGIAINLKKVIKIIFFILNIILYVITAFSVLIKGGFVEDFITNIILSSSITGAVFTLVDLFFIFFEKKGSLAIFFCFVLFFVLMMIMNFFIIQTVNIKRLKTLDSISQDNSLFSYVDTPNQFFLLAACGIKFSHPIILDLTLFNLALEKWEKNQYVYLMYAKFISIYPEETVTLKFIYKTVKLQKLKGSAIRCIKKQIPTILRHREFGLTNELRSKINAIKKQNASNRHKLGHVWDVVIRANLNEIEASTKHAISSINETNVDLKHLLREYPNNRNVTFVYSNFLSDLMADHFLSKEMHERTKVLLPGVTVFEDQTYEYGIKMFPNLPSSIREQKEPIILSSTMEAGLNYDNDTNEIGIDYERNKDLDQVAGIKMNINELMIPSIVGTKLIRILTTLFLFVIPCIFGLIYIEYYIKILERPLQFIGSLSLLQARAFQVVGFSLRYIGEEIDVFNKNIYKDERPPVSFGNTWNTKKQLEYIVEETTNALQDFGSFRKFEDNNELIDKARNLIFHTSVPYDYYTSSGNFTRQLVSISGGILDFTIQQRIVLSAYKIEHNILDSAAVLNCANNIYWISANIDSALNYMLEFIDQKYEKSLKIRLIVLITLILVEVVIYSTTLIIEIKWLNSNKNETYQCLFSLPKNIVSNLAENRDSNKMKENQPEEMNKQEETILKIFNSSGNSESSFSDVIVIIIGTFFIVLFAIICIYLFCDLVFHLNETVRNSAPHLFYLLASYSMLLGSMNCFNEILFEGSGNPIPTVPFQEAYSYLQSYFEKSSSYYHLISAGGPSNQEVPFLGFTEGVKNAYPSNCSNYDYLNITKTLSIKEETFEDNDFNLSKILECSPVDMTFVLMEPFIMFSLIPYRNGIVKKIESKDPHFDTLWLHLISPLYERFFDPLHKQIFPLIMDNLNEQKGKYIPFITALLIAGIFVEVLLYLQILSIENHIRSVLSLLLHCSPSVIFSSTKISRILSGDFSSQQNESLDRNSGFFDIVFKSLPDAIMYTNTEMIIQQANRSCKRIFGDDVELVGKSIRDFFFSNKFTGNIETLFSSVNSNPTEEIAYKKGSTELILKATSMIACGKFVILCRDETQSHNYNTLILSEKQNSDKLLSTILPPSLVGRVQEGEKNISFSVQSASILFSDIVSFTPWCGSLPAEKVMSTLNIMFKRMDSILDTKHTMTKIKCIGDCYMAAGGIFAEINQPSIHAKEVVSFGLQSIKEIIAINEEINQNLRIRVGVNTGGPIVAGVLGIGKPTFEIIGPAINRAQQMEQNGVPMNVHISYAVYELICGLSFKFYNRRTIDCKDGKVETYLVEP